MSSNSRSRWVPQPPAKRRRNWQDLPEELTPLILHHLDAVDMILTARKVCRTWRRICSDPNLYRVVDLWFMGNPDEVNYDVHYVARHAVQLSRGQLMEFNLSYFGDDQLLSYICDRSSQLRCLHLGSCTNITEEGLIRIVKKIPMLVELHLYSIEISQQTIRAIGSCCPQLKTFRLNYQGRKGLDLEFDENALAIAKNMPGLCHGLCHLQLFGNRITSYGLLSILKSCPHLESLDIRQCFEIDLEPSLIRRLSQQMKYLRLPYDSTKDSGLYVIYELDSYDDDDPSDIEIAFDEYFDEYEYYSDDYEYYSDDYYYDAHSGASDIDSD